MSRCCGEETVFEGVSGAYRRALIAAAAVTATSWPDLIVAAIMATLFVNASIGIIRQSLGELAEARVT